MLYDPAKAKAQEMTATELAATGFTIQSLLTMPTVIREAIGAGLVEIGLTARNLGIHNLYIPSYVSDGHIRMARSALPVGLGATDLEIGTLAANGFNQVSMAILVIIIITTN